MERWLFTVENNCRDTAREKELNDWYDTIHLPDILETPGFVRATRYENTNPAEGHIVGTTYDRTPSGSMK